MGGFYAFRNDVWGSGDCGGAANTTKKKILYMLGLRLKCTYHFLLIDRYDQANHQVKSGLKWTNEKNRTYIIYPCNQEPHQIERNTLKYNLQEMCRWRRRWLVVRGFATFYLTVEVPHLFCINSKLIFA